MEDTCEGRIFSRALYTGPVKRTYSDSIILLYIGKGIVDSVYCKAIHTNSFKQRHADQEVVRNLARLNRMFIAV